MLLVFRKLLKMIFCPTVFPLSQMKKWEQGKCLAKVMSRAEEGEGWGGPSPPLKEVKILLFNLMIDWCKFKKDVLCKEEQDKNSLWIMLEHKWLPLNITETVKALFPDHGNSSFFAPMLHCGLLLLCNVQSSAHIPKPSNSTTAYTSMPQCKSPK